MTANELRIGNIVGATLAGNFVPELTGIDKVTHDLHGFVPYTIRDGEGIDQAMWFFPILLTGEWLDKFGFKREEGSPTKNHGSYFSILVMDYKYSFSYAPFREDWGFYHSYTDAPNSEENNRYDFISCGIKYVHQLQNLFFCLTGEELKLK